jgi:hypothetical protein
MTDLSVFQNNKSSLSTKKLPILEYSIRINGVYNIQTLAAIKRAVFAALFKIMHVGHRMALKVSLHDSKNPKFSSLLAYLESVKKDRVCNELLGHKDPLAFDKTFKLLDSVYSTHFSINHRIGKVSTGAPISLLTSPHADKRGQEQFKKTEYYGLIKLTLNRGFGMECYNSKVTESEALYHEFIIKKVPIILDTVSKLYGSSITFSSKHYSHN